VGHLEILPMDLLNAHLDASFIFNHIGYYERWSKLLLCNRAAQKIWFITRSAWITCGDMARFVTNRCHTPLPHPRPSFLIALPTGGFNVGLYRYAATQCNPATGGLRGAKYHPRQRHAGMLLNW